VSEAPRSPRDSGLPTLSPSDAGAGGDIDVDIGLLLEGTYPYVSGGVSNWVHEIITGLPELTFGVIFLGAVPEAYGPIRYTLPPNLVHVEAHYLMAPGAAAPSAPRARGRAAQQQGGEAMSAMVRLHEGFQARDRPLDSALLDGAGALDTPAGISQLEFLTGDETWARLCAEYDARCASTSFLDYFWTVRTMHQPLFKLASLARTIPRFRILHAVSTGYAGFLGALVQRQRGCPFVVTEHGIYTKERKIDLAHASWIHEGSATLKPGLGEELGYLRRLWIHFFEGLGRAAYASARPIVSLYEGNRERQVADGAQLERTRVIPNGIDVSRFAPLRKKRPAVPPAVLGLIGRVVPIKDIKTFIRALRTVAAEIPGAEGWIVGPEDEDPRYAAECRALVHSLGLQDAVRFLGFRAPEDIFPDLGVSVLTSISEALPLFVLESFAAGVPVVTTDVGSCRELVEGRDPVDRARGVAGAVAAIASPDGIARAAIRLLQDPVAWQRASDAGVARVEALYTREHMFTQYRALYGAALEESHGRHRI
jgi:polysaccharide biosynthesis protein PelF